MIDDIEKAASGLHDIAGQAVHLDVAVVADDQALGGIKHDDALRNVVEHDGEQGAVTVRARAPRAKSPRGAPHGVQTSDGSAQHAENNDGKAPVLFEHWNSDRGWPR